MKVKHKILFVLLLAGLVSLLHAIIYAENGLLDLLRLKEQRESLVIENSEIGLKIFDEIDIFKRLVQNDLKLIEHIARSELKMIGKDELILIPQNPLKKSKTDEQHTHNYNNFRILTEGEIKELLNFDIDSFKFHDKLKENEKKDIGRQGN